jgi:hypothetical protein
VGKDVIDSHDVSCGGICRHADEPSNARKDAGDIQPARISNRIGQRGLSKPNVGVNLIPDPRAL